MKKSQEVVGLQVNEKIIYPLKSGRLFAVMDVHGKRGERISLAKQGLKTKLLFFHEEPANGIECSYSPTEGFIELGGTTTLVSAQNQILILYSFTSSLSIKILTW